MSEKLSGTPTTKPKVLVYGWYGKNNIGDDLFVEAFHFLFPQLEFQFVDTLDELHISGADAVFFGGGSFLYDPPFSTDAALELLSQKKIFYMGVGVEAVIHPIHQQLMSRACLIATRSRDQVERLKQINPNSMYIPDLVFALQDKVISSNKKPKSVLVIPNVLVTPQVSHPHWKHAAWSHYKTQFCQFLDALIEYDYQISFWPMCTNDQINDDWAAAELISHMDQRSTKYLLPPLFSNIEQVSKLVSSFQVVITQRYHGIVLAEMCKIPYISIHHHDKLKNFQSNNGKFLSYYSAAKQDLLTAFQQAQSIKFDDILPIETNIFEDFKHSVISLIK